MKYNSIQNNFSSGEIDRTLKGRIDIEEYFKGSEEMTNFIPMKSGGTSFRPGFGLSPINNTIDRLGMDYVVESFSPRDGEDYLVFLNPSDTPSLEIFIYTPGGTACTVTKDDYIWNLRADFTDSTAAYDSSTTATSNGLQHEDVLKGLTFVKQGDLLFIFDGTGLMAPVVVIRTGSNTFVVDSMLYPQQSDGVKLYLGLPNSPIMRVPYTDKNIDNNIRLKPAATTGANITLTSEDASAGAIDFFTGDVVGMLVKVTTTGTTGVGIIISKTSDSSVKVDILEDFGGTAASTNFETAVWNPRDGYPRTAAFFEGRLITGGNRKFPDTIWCSNTGNIFHFMQRRLDQDSSSDTSGLNFFGDVVASDPFSFIPASAEANNIQWLYPSDTLLVGTTRTEYAITGSDNGAISLASILVKPISNHGSSKVQPIKVGSSILFVGSNGRRLLEIPKRLSEYSHAIDIGMLNSSIIIKALVSAGSEVNKIDHQIRRMAWQEDEGVLWLLVDDGVSKSAILSLTYDKTAKTIAWAKHEIAGDVFIRSICCGRHPDGSYFTPYVWLEREDASYYSLEYLAPRNNADGILTNDKALNIDAFYQAASVSGDEITLETLQTRSVGSGKTYSVFAGISGNDYLEYLGEYVESSGVVTVPDEDFTARTVYLGLKYEGEIKTMPIEAGAQFGVAQGSRRRTHEVSVRVDRSLGGSYKASKALTGPFDVVGEKGSEDSLYTGEVNLSLNSSPDDHQVVIKQSQPYPLTLLWLLHKGYTYDVG